MVYIKQKSRLLFIYLFIYLFIIFLIVYRNPKERSVLLVTGELRLSSREEAAFQRLKLTLLEAQAKGKLQLNTNSNIM